MAKARLGLWDHCIAFALLHVGCAVAATLRDRGFDARYLRGGLSAWYAAGGPRALRPDS